MTPDEKLQCLEIIEGVSQAFERVQDMMTVTDQIEAIELLKRARQIIEDECNNAEHRHDISDEYADWERMREMESLLKRIDALFAIANQ